MFLLFFVHLAQAQTTPLQIQVSVMPPYSAYLQDYPGTGQRVRVFVINTSRQTYQVRLTGQLTGDNGIEIRTSPNYRPPRPLTVPPGQTLLGRADLEGLFDLNQIDVTGIDKNVLARGLPLPDGTYQLCVRAYSETVANSAGIPFGQPLSPEFPLGCSAPIVVRSVEPPILIAPLCDAEVTATTPQAVVFTWTPPAGVSPALVDYTLRIVELPQVAIDPNVFIDAVALPRSGVEVTNLRTSTFLYGPTQPSLVVGRRYAWRVQAFDRSRKLNFLNDGKAPVCSFTYGTGLPVLAKTPGMELVQTPALVPGFGVIPGLGTQTTPPTGATATAMMLKSETILATCSCKQMPTDSVVDNSGALTKQSATIANGFPLTFLKDVKEDPDKKTLSGTAMVPMPIVNSAYAKVRCRLIDVQCNAAGEVISGYVQAIQTSKTGPWPAYTKPNLVPDPLTSDQISNLGQFWQNYQDGVVSEANNTKQSVGWEVPFGIQKSVGSFGGVFTITDLTFTPGDAYFNANTWISVPEVAKFKGIPLSASHVCIKWNGTRSETCGDKVLYLADSVNIGAGSQLVLSLKGPKSGFGTPDPNTATHAKYTDKGLDSLHVVAGLTSPVLKRAQGAAKGQPLEMLTTFDVKAPDFDNWTAQFSTADDFYVVGLKDFTFSMKDTSGTVQPAIYDHDTNANPGIMPADYEPGKDPTWHGLFMPQMTLSLPLLKSLHNGNDLPVGVQNMILDANGFTGRAFAGSSQKPLIALGDGSLSGWYCSTDQLSLSIVQSSLVSGAMNGQVVMPIFKYNPDSSDKSSVWPWTSTYTVKDNSFQFVVSPKDSAYADVWKARLTILKDGKTPDPNTGKPNATAITVTSNDQGLNAKAVLNLNLSLNTGIIIAPFMSVEGLTFQTSPPAGEDYFSPGLFNAGLNSPQRYIGGDDEDSGLPLELTQVTAGKAASQKIGEYDIDLMGVLNLTKISSLTAGATGYVRFRVGNDAKGRPDWGYVTTGITSASVNGSLGPITLNGGLTLFGYNDDVDDNYGKGVKADLTVSVLGASFGGATLEGYFGSKKDAQGSFRYWQVGGAVTLPGTGVPIAPAVNLRKFGGGAFNNMTMTVDTTAKGEPTGTIGFVPHRGGCGFQAAVGLNTVDGTALGLTGRLTVGFNDCDGDLSLNNITLDANAQLLVADKPLAEGRGLFSIDFKNSLITGVASLNADYSVADFYAKGHGELGLHVDLKDANNFFFYLGKPTTDADRVTVTMGMEGVAEANFGTYFFMGNAKLAGIAKLPPDPYKVDPALLQQLGYVGGTAPQGNALAFGAGLSFKSNNTFGPFYIDFSAQVGFDLVLQQGISCAGDASVDTPAPAVTSPGINGWYASGQLYAALDLALGIDVDLWFYSGRLEALRITAAALLEGGMVNPVWLHGSALLKYRVLGGRIRGSVQAEFWYRKEHRCVIAMQQPNPFASMPIISMVLPGSVSKDPVAAFTPLYAEFNYPVRSLIEVNDVDAQSKPLNTFRTFRLDFMPGKQFKLVAFNSKAPGNASCASIETGRLQLGGSDDGSEGSYNATFYRDASLQPYTSYSLTVGIQVYLKAANCTTTPVNNCGPQQNGWAEYLFAGKNKDGSLGQPVSVNETKTTTFTTGECNGTLTREGGNSATVSFSFPFEGQRYFTVGDASNGFIEMLGKLCCGDKIKSDANFDLGVRFVPFAGQFAEAQALYATNVKFDDDVRIAYSIPNGLKKQTLYRLDVVRIPNDNFVKAQEAELERQKTAAMSGTIAILSKSGLATNPTNTLVYSPGLNTTPAPGGITGGPSTKPVSYGAGLTASINPGIGLGDKAVKINKQATAYVGTFLETQQFGNGQTGNAVLSTGISASAAGAGSYTMKITPEQQAAAIKKKFEQVLYSYPFQTSRYNTLADKLNDTKVQTGQVQVNQTLSIFAALPDGVFTVPMQAGEGFDTYELDWNTVGNGKVRPPLVLVRASETGNGWFNNFVKPTVDLINAMSKATNAYGQKIYYVAGVGGQQYGLSEVKYDVLMRKLMSFNSVFDSPQPPISQAEIIGLGATQK